MHRGPHPGLALTCAWRGVPEGSADTFLICQRSNHENGIFKSMLEFCKEVIALSLPVHLVLLNHRYSASLDDFKPWQNRKGLKCDISWIWTALVVSFHLSHVFEETRTSSNCGLCSQTCIFELWNECLFVSVHLVLIFVLELWQKFAHMDNQINHNVWRSCSTSQRYQAYVKSSI